ncbi:MAG: hypothetical protein U0869_07875 [Chloroflexota bacterium]
MADIADVAWTAGRSEPPVVLEPPPGVRFVDRRQVVRYRAGTEAEARALATADAPVAARAGFVPVDDGWRRTAWWVLDEVPDPH